MATPSDCASPSTPAARRAAPRIASIVAIVLCIGCVAAAGLCTSGLWVYSGGYHNDATPFESPFRTLLLWLIAAAQAFLLGVWVVLWHALGVRGWRTAVVTVIVAIAACVVPFGTGVILSYDEGLARWAERHVDADAIRAWASTSPGGTQTVMPVSDLEVLSVPPAAWPPAIASLVPVPDEVYLTPDGWIILSFGIPAEFNGRRQVFIAPREESGRHAYARSLTKARPGVYAGEQ